MKIVTTTVLAITTALVLTACSAIDEQLEPRSNAINEATDSARNDAILINIIRASQSQPLNFTPISKASGTQTTDLKLTLPTAGYGPGHTTTQNQFPTGSTWDNSVGNSFDTAPIQTHDFYQSMLSAEPVELVDTLIHDGLPRELVFDMFIESVRATDLKTGIVTEFRNDPLTEPSSLDCPSAAAFYGRDGIHLNSLDNIYSPGSKSSQRYKDCEYHRFEFLLQKALAWGLNVETVSVANPDYSAEAVQAAKTAGKTPPAKTIPKSNFCFDLAYAVDDEKSHVKGFPDVCGSGRLKSASNTSLSVRFANIPEASDPYSFVLRMRSPTGVFRYIGHLLRSAETNPVRLYWADSIVQKDNSQLLVVNRSVSKGCFAKAEYFGNGYCVPYEGADQTKQVFSVLDQLVALSTTTGSLPTTLDVRVQ